MKRLTPDLYTVLPVEGAPDNDCPICLAPGNIQSSDETVKLNVCEHVVHLDCLEQIQQRARLSAPFTDNLFKRDAIGHNALWYYENHE